MTPARANLTDDRYDGNIFALYAGNGAIVPARVTLAQSFELGRPTMLVLYLDDSSDCKRYAVTVSKLHDNYSRRTSFVPVNIDSLPIETRFDRTEPGYYFDGFVPKTVVFDGSGNVRFEGKGQIPFETLDDVFRDIFEFPPRPESSQLKLQPLNEVTPELAN